MFYFFGMKIEYSIIPFEANKELLFVHRLIILL
jgi:hypothetical protein